MPRPGRASKAGSPWWWLLAHIADPLLTAERRATWLAGAALRCGRLVGSVRCPQAGRVLFDALEAGMREFGGLGFLRRVTVRPAALGQNAGLVGAAAPLLAPDRYGAADPALSPSLP